MTHGFKQPIAAADPGESGSETYPFMCTTVRGSCIPERTASRFGAVLVRISTRPRLLVHGSTLSGQYQTIVLQALRSLTGESYRYDPRKWGPGTRNNERAIKQFEAWLQGATSGAGSG